MCNKEGLKKSQIELLKKLIDEDYRYRLYIDGIPNRSIEYHFDQAWNATSEEWTLGVPFGFKEVDSDGNTRYLLVNHWKINMDLINATESTEDDEYDNIYGFRITARSYKHLEDVERADKEHEFLYLDEIEAEGKLSEF